MNKKIPQNSSLLSWFKSPNPGHVAQLYQSTDELMGSLREFIGTGLSRDEVCIVIATEPHLRRLEAELEVNHDLEAKRRLGLYRPLDAKELLATFMVDDMPDRQLFFKVTANLFGDIEKSADNPIRAFGEMVALLWKKGNGAAVNELERLWNEMLQSYPISLYCAYPMIYFDSSIHGDMLDGIDHAHDVVTPTYSRRKDVLPEPSFGRPFGQVA